MNKLEYLIIHCTATPEGRRVTPSDIKKWHTAPPPKGRGWSKMGYTDLFGLNGEVWNLTPFDQDDEVDGFEVTNGVRGMNSISRHICYVGGVGADGKPKDTRTPAQFSIMSSYIKLMIARYPDIKVAGHNQFDAGKACPSFDVPAYLHSIMIPEKNIHKANQV